MTEPQRETRDITSLGEWLAWRREHVTASRVSALFDQHPFLSRDGLAAELRGESGEVPNSSMRAGHILEAGFPTAVKHDGKPWELVKANTYHWLPEHRLGATPDFWIGDDGLFQAKTASVEQWEKWRGHVPLGYTIQTLTEMLVTGRAWGVLAVMIRHGGYPIHYFDVPRHAAAEGRILDAVREWWRAWDAGDIPAAAPSDALAADLDDGSYRDLSDDNELPLVLEERAALKATTSIAEKRLKEIDTAIKDRMGPASTAWLPGWELTYRATERAEFTVPAKTVRTLRIKATRGDADEDAA